MRTLHSIDWMQILKWIGYICTAIAGGYAGGQI